MAKQSEGMDAELVGVGITTDLELILPPLGFSFLNQITLFLDCRACLYDVDLQNTHEVSHHAVVFP